MASLAVYTDPGYAKVFRTLKQLKAACGSEETGSSVRWVGRWDKGGSSGPDGEVTGLKGWYRAGILRCSDRGDSTVEKRCLGGGNSLEQRPSTGSRTG